MCTHNKVSANCLCFRLYFLSLSFVFVLFPFNLFIYINKIFVFSAFFKCFFNLDFRFGSRSNMLTHLQTLMRCSSNNIASSGHKVSPSTSLVDDDSITPCSGRGDCLNGTCLCEIRYSGDECDNYNLPYHAGTYMRSQIFSFYYFSIELFCVIKLLKSIFSLSNTMC